MNREKWPTARYVLEIFAFYLAFATLAGLLLVIGAAVYAYPWAGAPSVVALVAGIYIWGNGRMSRMKIELIVGAVAVAALGGCSVRPDVYTQQSWAKVSQGQAEAECEAAVQSLQVINMYYCMKAKGYEQQ